MAAQNECDVCGVSFSSYKLLQAHIVKSKKCPCLLPTELTCEHCGLVLKRKYTLARHLVRKHGQPEIEPAWDDDWTQAVTPELIEIAMADESFPRMRKFIESDVQTYGCMHRGGCELLCSILKAFYAVDPSRRNLRINELEEYEVYMLNKAWMPISDDTAYRMTMLRLMRCVTALSWSHDYDFTDRVRTTLRNAIDHHNKNSPIHCKACKTVMRRIIENAT